MYHHDLDGGEEDVDEDRKYSNLIAHGPWSRESSILRQISAGSNEGATGTSAISGGVSSDGSNTSDISNKDTPSGQSTSETSGQKPGQSGISSGISDLAKTDAITGGVSIGVSKLTGGLSGTTSEDIRMNEERTERDELAQFYNKYYETDLDGSPKIPDYEKLGSFSF